MQKKAFIYIITAGVLWGTSGLFANALGDYGFSSMQMTAARGSVSFLCMLAYVLLRDRGLLKITLRELLLFFCNGIALFSTAYLYYTAMQMTSVATAVVLMYTMPIIVMIFSVLFLGEKMTRLKLTATAIMMIGCVLVSGIIGGLRINLLGILIGLLSGITYSAYSIISKIAFKGGSSPISASLYGFMFMGVIATGLCRPLDAIEKVTSPKIFALLIGLGVVTFVIPYFLYTLSLKYLPAGTASALSIVEPMAATVFGMIFLDEIPDIFAGVGIILIISAVFLLGVAEGRQDNEKPSACADARGKKEQG